MLQMNYTKDLLTSGLPHTWTCNERTDHLDFETGCSRGRAGSPFLEEREGLVGHTRSGAFEAQEVRVFISSRIQLAMMMTMMPSSTKGDAANSVSVLCVKAQSH